MAAIAMATTSCRGGETTSAPLPKPPPVVGVTLSDYRFEFDSEIPAGRVVFRFMNAGAEAHRPSLLALEENFPPIDAQLRGTQRRAITPLAGINERLSGATGNFAVDLIPGRRYAFVCFARSAEGEMHGLKGMTFEFHAPTAQEPSR